MPGQDANTKLLLHCDGANASTIITDAIGVHTVTAVGDAQLETAVKKWGTASCKFDGTGDYLSIPDSADWDIVGDNTSDYTIDLQVSHTDHAGSEEYVCQREDTSNYWLFFHSDGTGIRFLGNKEGTLFISMDGGEITDSLWHHVALIKTTGFYGIYKDGVQVAYAWTSVEDTYSTILSVGSNQPGGTAHFDGNLDEVRVQADNYFLAAPNSFPAAPLIIYGEGSQGDTTTTNAGYGGSPTLSTVTLSTSSTILNATTSMSFDGSSSYATVADSADWDVVGSATDSWTIDLQVKHTDHAGQEMYVDQYEANTDQWRLYHLDGTGIRFDAITGGGLTSRVTGGEITDTNWHHVAMVKSGSNYGIYIDGIQSGYTSDADTDTYAGPLYIGADGAPGSYFDGYMEQVQITKGNKFGVVPNVGTSSTITVPTAILVQDTIDVPTAAYAVSTKPYSQGIIIT